MKKDTQMKVYQYFVSVLFMAVSILFITGVMESNPFTTALPLAMISIIFLKAKVTYSDRFVKFHRKIFRTKQK